VDNAQSALQEVISQGDKLKGVRRKVLDVINNIGISQSVLSSVSRRERIDRLLVFGGMILITLLLLMVWWFV